MMSARASKAIDKLAEKLIDVFHDEDVSEEIALQALTRVIAVIVCDQPDIPDKIKALVHNISVLMPVYREKFESRMRSMLQ